MVKLQQSATSFIFILILIICIFTNSTSVSATQTLNSNINISWENNTTKPVIPREEIKQLNLTVEYKVDYGNPFATGAMDVYGGKSSAIINLEITDHSPWCFAALSLTTLLVPITTGVTSFPVRLNVHLGEEAPAFGEGSVTIRAHSGKLGIIGPFDKQFTLEFIAGYLPRISANLPRGTTKNIGPMGTAEFLIDITNLGNARTTVFFAIENLSGRWKAVINDDVTLNENGQSTVTLTILPPRDVGYHDERQSFLIKMTPARAEDLTNIGYPSYLTVVVQSRGFSTPGFEGFLFISALAIVLLSVGLIRKKKK
ncbi:MAG: hypothetical protein JXA00_06705 [Candidatus Thermoplasmatota archaeon]|nr:hypothetical protein [Candidatus Thermoplasmatota archaeon]